MNQYSGVACGTYSASPPVGHSERVGLVPAWWRQTLARLDTQRLLEANIYPRAILRPAGKASTIDAVP